MDDGRLRDGLSYLAETLGEQLRSRGEIAFPSRNLLEWVTSVTIIGQVGFDFGWGIDHTKPASARPRRPRLRPTDKR